jgi:hypothetical protein
VTLVGADGSRSVLACSDEPYQLGPSSIWGVGLWSVESRAIGELPGQTIDTVRAEARTVTVHVVITGTEAEQDDAVGELGRILSPTDDCRIIYARPDGITRELTALYVGGGDAIVIRHNRQRAVRLPLVFRAHFPFWRSATGPSVLANETFVGQGLPNPVTITGQGDVPSWPVITVTGPAQNIQGMNMVTGQTWRITEVIAAGQTLRIDTDPREVGVWVDDIADAGILDPTSELWPIMPGLNYVTMSARGDGVGGIGTFSIRWQVLFDSC